MLPLVRAATAIESSPSFIPLPPLAPSALPPPHHIRLRTSGGGSDPGGRSDHRKQLRAAGPNRTLAVSKSADPHQRNVTTLAKHLFRSDDHLNN
ncbi:hypothetical protein J6590_052701 [Homalodisca vitripennis]|nr:hypothetical protein J6590_103091 [Homalodisca vitripennis]KAG8301523.1 hypothetical protein J6590_052701 [Homalodisca vitripennis]